MPDCTHCGVSDVVSRHVHEAALDRLERVNKRLFIAWILTFVMLVSAIVFFVWYESQFEDVVTEITQETEDGGYNNYIGNDGDIYNGKTDGQDEKARPQDGR